MKKLIKILRAIWSYLTGKRYVSELKMIGASVWWGEERKLTVRSFTPILASNAIGFVNEASAKIYFPVELYKVNEGVYEAKIRLYAIMLPNQLEKWVEKIDEHPFL